MNEMIDRVPPHNHEAEQSVIGAIFLEPPSLITVAEIVMAEDFYRIAHQKIFQTMLNLADQGKAIDVVTVTEELSVKKELEDIGGLSYLTEIANAVPTAANVAHYAHIVEEKALLRRLIRVATTIVEDGFTREDEVEALLSEAEKKMMEVSSRKKPVTLPTSKMFWSRPMTISNFCIHAKETLQASLQASATSIR